MEQMKKIWKKAALFWPTYVALLAAVIGVAAYEKVPVRNREKAVPVFQLAQEQTEGAGVIDFGDEETLKPVEREEKSEVVVLAVEDEEQLYKDGEYYGTGNGFSGKLTVKVTIEDGKITDIVLVENEADDEPYVEKAVGLFGAVIDGQTTNVDTVSGATYSSAGLIEAIRNALAQAVISEDGQTTLTETAATTEEKTTSEKKTKAASGEKGTRYKNGTYTGVTICNPDSNEEFDAYTLSLKVKVDNDRIINITDIKGYGENYITANDRFIELAVEGNSDTEGLVNQILDKGAVTDKKGKNLDFDTVSSATCSSNAIVTACKAAMKEALVEQSSTEEKESDETTTKKKKEKETTTEEITTSGEDGSVYENGTFSGKTTCYADEEDEFDPYTLSLKIVMDGDKIVGITDLAGSGDDYITFNDRYIEKAGNGTDSEKGMIAQILAKGTVYKNNGDTMSFDAVSSATCSSNAIVAACADAMNAAKKKGDVEESSQTTTQEPTTQPIATKEPTTLEENTTLSEEETTTDTETAAGRYQDGYYDGQAACYPDEEEEFDEYILRLRVQIAQGRIAAITDITGEGDDFITANNRYITRAAQGYKTYLGLVAQIIAVGDMYNEEGTDITFDTVSSATCTSNSIIHAVKNALESAVKE